MNFLKKLGQVVATGLQLFTGFAPIFAATVPASASTISHVTDDVTKIAGMVQMVEVVAATLADKGLAGTDKLRAATPLVAQVILQSEVMAGHGPDDQALFLQGCQKLADGMADVLNSRKG